jgi:lipopolysaccharide/colanic/teichoic acid biosynthesis glycosyltransferase
MTDGAKRGFDLAVAGGLLVVTAPLQLGLAVLVRRRIGRPALFRQLRVGRGGRPFLILKLRTMVDPDPDRGLISDADRLPPLGAWLRATSLDELPTLVNVLSGAMSLVGPRPLPLRYLDRYDADQLRRHDVRPGVTGLAQVRGRNALPWADRLAADVAYVDHHSAALDARILARTLVVVLARRGIAAPGAATMPEFTGARRP